MPIFKNKSPQYLLKLPIGVPINHLTPVNFITIPVLQKVKGEFKELNRTYVICKCTCGSIKNYLPNHVINNRIKSCSQACSKDCSKDIRDTKYDIRVTHDTVNYRKWTSFKYQAKLNGIEICKELENFIDFIKHMGNAPSKNHSIGRVDNKIGFTLYNTVWRIKEANRINNKRAKEYTINGITKPGKVWAEEYNIDYKLVNSRLLYLDWDILDALTTPVNTKPLKNKQC